MPSDDNFLLANLLITQQGDEAREYATRKMWQAKRNKDKETEEKWFEVLGMLKAIYMQKNR